MPLIKEQKLLNYLENTPDLKAIKVITTTENFENRFEGSVSLFFRSLKNGLNSFGSISNRTYFKNLSGCYFSLGDEKQFEIIILYDNAMSSLNRIQVTTRIKKLLGLNTQIEFGEFNDFKERLKNMIGIVRKTQTFGDFYFNKDDMAD